MTITPRTRRSAPGHHDQRHDELDAGAGAGRAVARRLAAGGPQRARLPLERRRERRPELLGLQERGDHLSDLGRRAAPARPR